MDAERLLATSEVAMEYAALSNFPSDDNEGHCPQGIYVIPSSSDSVLLWDGVLFVHQGTCNEGTSTNYTFIASKLPL